MSFEQFDANKAISQMINTLIMIPKIFEENYERVGYYDNESNDLLHALELTNFNASEGYKHAKRLKENRVNRRKCKDQNQIMKPLFDLIKKNNQFLSDLKKCQVEMQKLKSLQQERVYHPRVMDELAATLQKTKE